MLDAYTTMLPRLQAEDDLRLVNAVAAGTGSMSRADLGSFLRERQRAARARREAPQTTADLEKLGVRVERVPLKQEPASG